MKRNLGVCMCRLTVGLVLVGLAAGCATSRTAGLNTAMNHVATIERIANNRHLYNLTDYQGVAVVSMGKLGAVGFGAMGWSSSVYVRDPASNAFGPPSFVNAGGASAGIAYGGLNVVNCLLLFRNREDAIRFAERSATANFSNEASLLVWGRKQMTVPGAISFSDGAGLCVGAVELELLLGGPRDGLHANLYEPGATVQKILLGDVAIPAELKATLARLNLLMQR